MEHEGIDAGPERRVEPAAGSDAGPNGPAVAGWAAKSLPLLMFGPIGYGRVIGRIARPGLFVQALAPFVVASAVERFSDRAVLEMGIVGALAALLCFLAIRPGTDRSRAAPRSSVAPH